MQASETDYRRLPGKGRRRGSFIRVTASSSRLWLGRDHLLLVDSTGYEENYKRFYFRDITAITIQRTNRGRVIGIVSGLWLALGVALALVTGMVGAWVFGIMSAIIMCVFVGNMAMGPTAVCHLRTAVQVEELACWNRLRRARTTLERIRPLIIAEQGELSTQELQSAMDEPVASPPIMDAPPRIVASAVMPPPPNNYRGGAHLFLFSLLVLDVLTTTIDLMFQSTLWDVVNTLILVVIIIAALVALVRQRRSCLPKSIRWMAAGTLVMLCVSLFISMVHGMILVMNSMDGSVSLNTVQRTGFSLWMAVISTAITGFIGAYGLVLMRRFRKTLPTPPPKISSLPAGPPSTPS